jgi:hypothetical protein
MDVSHFTKHVAVSDSNIHQCPPVDRQAIVCHVEIDLYLRLCPSVNASYRVGKDRREHVVWVETTIATMIAVHWGVWRR